MNRKMQMKIPRPRSQGFSLIELMIAVVIGMIVMLGVMSIFGQSLRNNRDLLASARLNQDLGTVASIMANDLRRAGYSGGALAVYGGGEPNIPSPPSTPEPAGWFNARNADLNIVEYNGTPSCILYSYNLDLGNPDSDGDGTVEPNQDTNPIGDNERFGFRLNTTDGAIEMRTSCTPDTATDRTDACYTDCTEGAWEQVTDPEVVTITELSFSSVGSKCIDRNSRNYWTTVEPGTPTVYTDDPIEFPCDATAADDVSVMYYDRPTRSYSASPPASITGWSDLQLNTPTGPGYAAQSLANPASWWDSSAETRQVVIHMVAELASDPEVTKETTTSVKVNNNRVFVAPAVTAP